MSWEIVVRYSHLFAMPWINEPFGLFIQQICVNLKPKLIVATCKSQNENYKKKKQFEAINKYSKFKRQTPSLLFVSWDFRNRIIFCTLISMVEISSSTNFIFCWWWSVWDVDTEQAKKISKISEKIPKK